MTQKKRYEEPYLEISDFEVCNIISASVTPIDGGEGGEPEDPLM